MKNNKRNLEIEPDYKFVKQNDYISIFKSDIRNSYKIKVNSENVVVAFINKYGEITFYKEAFMLIDKRSLHEITQQICDFSNFGKDFRN